MAVMAEVAKGLVKKTAEAAKKVAKARVESGGVFHKETGKTVKNAVEVDVGKRTKGETAKTADAALKEAEKGGLDAGREGLLQILGLSKSRVRGQAFSEKVRGKGMRAEVKRQKKESKEHKKGEDTVELFKMRTLSEFETAQTPEGKVLAIDKLTALDQRDLGELEAQKTRLESSKQSTANEIKQYKKIEKDVAMKKEVIENRNKLRTEVSAGQEIPNKVSDEVVDIYKSVAQFRTPEEALKKFEEIKSNPIRAMEDLISGAVNDPKLKDGLRSTLIEKLGMEHKQEIDEGLNPIGPWRGRLKTGGIIMLLLAAVGVVLPARYAVKESSQNQQQVR